MLHAVIQKNTYMDSVELMVLSKNIAKEEGVIKATIMMGTPANIEIMKKGGFECDALLEAKANDMVIVVDTLEEAVVGKVVEAVKLALNGKKEEEAQGSGLVTIKSWEQAKKYENHNICVISVPGEYAADEAKEALKLGKHVMLFSDNVTKEEEKAVKTLAHEKGLLVMGPDCGTSILNGVPLAFANNVKRGSIGIAGASGTGIQEVSVMIERMGGGISHAIGTGGRDLYEEIGAITMKDSIAMLEKDSATNVIVVVSKPPAESVKNELKEVLQSLTKPAVVLFLGERGCTTVNNVHFVENLEQVARKACELASYKIVECDKTEYEITTTKKQLIGLYSGGTLASEAVCMIKESMELFGEEKKEGYMLSSKQCIVLDLGDDLYTKGKPHPMMDGAVRNQKLQELLQGSNEEIVVLMDVVLGVGSSSDPALELVEIMKNAPKEVEFVVNLLGTVSDYQGLDAQMELLKEAGATVFLGNTMAVKHAIKLIGHSYEESAPVVENKEITKRELEKPSDAMMDLINQKPAVINVGLKGFAKDLENERQSVIHFEWRPVAGGNKLVKQAIDYLDGYVFEDGPYKTIDEANQAVLDKITESTPCLVDVVPANTATDVFEGKKLLLHAGPPMTWDDMTHPMQGSCVGAALFEGWATSEEEAWEMLKAGEVAFMPCHHAGFVGPMGGITSPNMAVLKVKNLAGNNFAYCTMNEGIGQVLRFGAYSQTVVDRLHFMADILGPTLSKALKTLENGVNINVMVSKAIAMGDEFHQRNIAASLVFLKEVAPIIVGIEMDNVDKQKVMKFLADTDQFFLNIMMAGAKAVMDHAATVHYGTVVTVMSRNGKDFGVRVSGMKQTWYTGPVNTPKGLYFTGFDEEMANPDMGDSAITETLGVGGMAMIAAPAVTRFVGTGGFYDALEISNRMSEICISHNGMFSIPTWDFKGACLGIDIRKVATTSITPVINTGIAHKVAGQGQIGAGTVNPPLECFTDAVVEYARQLGFKG